MSAQRLSFERVGDDTVDDTAMVKRVCASSSTDTPIAEDVATTSLDVCSSTLIDTPAAKRTAPSLLDILNRDRFPFWDYLCPYLPTTSIQALSQTCRPLRQQVLDVNRNLERFVTNARRLRALLGEHDALISGSFALQFFLAERWPGSDLDIFVRKGDGANALGAYLETEENYVLESGSKDSNYDWGEMREVKSYRRLDSARSKVQIIATQYQPINAILTGFYMTAVLNIISWNKAYCIFPYETMVQRKTFMLKECNEYFEGLLFKYSRRGFVNEDIVPPGDHLPASSLQGIRRIGDSRTLTVELPKDGVHPKSVASDVALEYSGFDFEPVRVLTDDPIDEPTCHYRIMTRRFVHISLRQEYSFPTACELQELLGGRLHKSAKMSLLSMPPADRPKWFGGAYGRTSIDHYWRGHSAKKPPHGFKRPHEWRYRDADVPHWYQLWFEELEADEKALRTTTRY
ncbi:uncharacterized protein AB675_9044 [Cyphellophora attinorum]|uniref:Uncharacterized protein n=1 Tax=Cyphellophora attinorum TaxID=1664694 RepID=A0A0N1HBD6_9EURO|nr:uncharacterized protein AB675_9044 [Phialophora attinorum]KPI41620.1 hypothetical protein AB675_9044 [Phialophora attinorum]